MLDLALVLFWKTFVYFIKNRFHWKCGKRMHLCTYKFCKVATCIERSRWSFSFTGTSASREHRNIMQLCFTSIEAVICWTQYLGISKYSCVFWKYTYETPQIWNTTNVVNWLHWERESSAGPTPTPKENSVCPLLSPQHKNTKIKIENK